MSWPMAFFKEDGKSKRAFRVKAYNAERDTLSITERLLNAEGTLYEEVDREIPVSSVFHLNWEAHRHLEGVLKDRSPCNVSGYGADTKAVEAKKQGYDVK